jgi:hypothetical protein
LDPSFTLQVRAECRVWDADSPEVTTWLPDADEILVEGRWLHLRLFEGLNPSDLRGIVEGTQYDPVWHPALLRFCQVSTRLAFFVFMSSGLCRHSAISQKTSKADKYLPACPLHWNDLDHETANKVECLAEFGFLLLPHLQSSICWRYLGVLADDCEVLSNRLFVDRATVNKTSVIWP